jgi:hypothetical protein
MGIVEVGAEIDDARLVRDRDESSGDGDDVGDGAGDGGEDVGHGFVVVLLLDGTVIYYGDGGINGAVRRIFDLCFSQLCVLLIVAAAVAARASFGAVWRRERDGGRTKDIYERYMLYMGRS